MRSISARWLRRVFSAIKKSPQRIPKRRNLVRKLILESLEIRQLMSSTPWILPTQTQDSAPLNTHPTIPAWAPTAPQQPKPVFESQSSTSSTFWTSPRDNNIFGPREMVWISEFNPTVESGKIGYFRIERSNPIPAIEVTFNILADSTAQADIDYFKPDHLVIFDPGQSFVDVAIAAIDDSLTEPTESVQIVLWDCSRIGTWLPSDITSIQISDNDFNDDSVLVELLEPIDAEEGYRDGRLRARRTGPLSESLTVPFQLSLQSNLFFDDDFRIDPGSWSYETNHGQFFFPAGEPLASLSVIAIDDLVPEATEWMDIQLLPDLNDRYKIGGKPVQTLRFIDNDNREKPSLNHSSGTIQVCLMNDTGISPTDRITWDERIEVSVDANLYGDRIKTEFDWDGDFIPDAIFWIENTPSPFQFDPRSYDPNLVNQNRLRCLRYRSLRYNQEGVLIDQSPWNSFEYQSITDPSEGPLRLSDLRLCIDTANNTDRITSDPSLTVSIQGEYPSSRSSPIRALIQWDQNQDGVADASEPLYDDQRIANYDPRSIDPDFARIAGPRSIRARLVDPESVSPLSPWETLDFTIANAKANPWFTMGITHEKSEMNPHEWIIRGKVSNANGIQEMGKGELLESPTTTLSVQIDTDLDGQPNATIPLTEDFTFEHIMRRLSPEDFTLKFRVQQWANDHGIFTFGNWTEHTINVPKAEPIPIPTPRLRLDDGLSNHDQATGDPTILIETGLSDDRDHQIVLEIDLDGDSNSDSVPDRSIPVGKNEDGSTPLVTFFDESITSGPKYYRFRTKIIDLVSNTQIVSDWADFIWNYCAATAPSIRLDLLCDDGISTHDAITSISTIVGNINSFSDYQNPESMLILLDLDSDSKIDLSIAPSEDGSFSVRPEISPLDHQHLSARVAWTDPYRNIELLGDWTSLHFQWIPEDNTPNTISNLQLLFDTGRSSTDRISSVSTITGLVSDKQHCIGVQVDRNGDGIPDQEIDFDPEGRFRYSPMGLDYATHLFAFRTIETHSDQDSPKFGPWERFDFTYVASTLEPVVIDAVGLINDSGTPGDLKSEQGRVSGRVSSASGIENTLILIDWNLDGQADESIVVDPDGRFFLDPKTVSGQVNVALQALRIGPVSSAQSESDRWVHFSYILEDQEDTPPELIGLDYIANTKTKTGSLAGSVRCQRPVEGMYIEIDTDRDGLADHTTRTDHYGNFLYPLSQLNPGDYTFSVRALAKGNLSTTDLVGSWNKVSFSILTPSVSPASFKELRLRVDDGPSGNDRITSDPTITGKIDRDAICGVLIIEFDTDGDSITDANVIPTADLSFQYTPTQLTQGAFEFRARIKEQLPDGNTLRSNWSAIQGTLDSERKSNLIIGSIELAADQGFALNDHRSTQTTLTGTVLQTLDTSGKFWVDLDIDRDGVTDQTQTFSGTIFNVTPRISQYGMVDLAIRIRDESANSASTWYAYEFLYHPQPRSPEAEAWIHSYRSIAKAINQGKSEHVQGLAQAIERLNIEKKESELSDRIASNDSFTSRLRAFQEISVGYSERTNDADTQLQTDHSVALNKLRERLAVSDDHAMLWLPEELEIQWPSNSPPRLPYLETNWLPDEETLPQPPLRVPEAWKDTTVSEVTWSTSYLQALDSDPISDIGMNLSGDSEIQLALQKIRSDLISERSFISQIANMARARARLAYDAAISTAESNYRQSMSVNRLELSNPMLEDYSHIYRTYSDETTSITKEYNSRRQELEDRYRQAFKFLNESHLEKKRTSLRNRALNLDSANRELARLLNTIPPPSWKSIDKALQHHARKTYDAHFDYDQSILLINSHESTESFKLQRDQLTESLELDRLFSDQIAELDYNREIAIAEQKMRNSLHRGSSANRWESSKELALTQLEIARTQAWSDWQQEEIQVEYQRRIGDETALRQFDLSVASALCLAFHRIHASQSSLVSNAQLQKALSRKQLLNDWESDYEQQSHRKADLWKELATEKLKAEVNKKLSQANDQHQHNNLRISATFEYRSQHAQLVFSHAQSKQDARSEAIKKTKQAERNRKLQAQLNSIRYYESEANTTFESQQKTLDALVYKPPVLAGWTHDWGWLDGTFLGTIAGSAIIPPSTGAKIARDDSIATAQRLFDFETNRIEIERSFFHLRDQIEDSYAKTLETNANNSRTSEQELLKEYHLKTAKADRDFAVSEIDRDLQFETHNAVAIKNNKASLNNLQITANQQHYERWIEHQRSVQQIEFESFVSQWDHYLYSIAKWRDSEPNPWTEYIANQAAISKNLNIRFGQIAIEVSRQQNPQNQRLLLNSQEIEIHNDSKKLEIETNYIVERAIASRELGIATAEARYRFAQQTAGNCQGTAAGPNSTIKRSNTPELLQLKHSLSDATAKADLDLARAQFDLSRNKADALYDQAIALQTLWTDFSNSDLNWDQYCQRVALVQRVLSDRLDFDEKSFLAIRQTTDAELRASRAETIQKIATEIERSNMVIAQWEMLEDIPISSAHQEFKIELARATKIAKDRFANSLGQLELSRDVTTAQANYQRSVDLRKINTEKSRLHQAFSQRRGYSENEATEIQRSQSIQNRNEYERTSLENQLALAEQTHKKLDPQTRLLFRQQIRAWQVAQAKKQEALAWRELAESAQRTAIYSESISSYADHSEGLDHIQNELAEATDQTNQATSIQQAQHHAQWLVARELALNAFEYSEAQIQAEYDQRSTAAIDSINRDLSELLDRKAQQTGEAWKTYYLTIHYDSAPLHPSMRREIDSWLGLQFQKDLLSGAIWRLEPLASMELSNATNQTVSDRLRDELLKIQNSYNANTTDARIAFALTIGTAKSNRVRQRSDANVETSKLLWHAQELMDDKTCELTILQQSKLHLLQSNAARNSDELQATYANNRHQRTLQNLHQSNSIEYQFQQRILQTSANYEQAWAEAQCEYFANTTKRSADQFAKSTHTDLRSRALSSHLVAYAGWIQDVSDDYVDWVTEMESAKLLKAIHMLEIDQQQIVSRKVAQGEFELKSDAAKRAFQLEKASEVSKAEIARLNASHLAKTEQQQIDNAYRLEILGHESTYFQVVEQTASAIQVMALQGHSLINQIQKSKELLADAKHIQVSDDLSSALVWKNQTASKATVQSIIDAQASNEEHLALDQLDDQIELHLAQLEKDREDAFSRARFDFQISSIESSNNLSRNRFAAQSKWLITTADARILARNEIKESVPGEWSDFLFNLALKQQNSLAFQIAADEQLMNLKVQVDQDYASSIAQAQLDAAITKHQAILLSKERKIRQRSQAFQAEAQIDLDYQERIARSAGQYVEIINNTDFQRNLGTLAAENDFRKDCDPESYREKLNQLAQDHESQTKIAKNNWDTQVTAALANKRSSRSTNQRKEQLELIESESKLAEEIRAIQLKLIEQEATAYEDSELAWASFEKDHAMATATLQIDMALELDQSESNPWSSFFLDVTQAKANYDREIADATCIKVQKESQKQSEHERKQGLLQSIREQSEWTASQIARMSVAQIDWALEQVKAQAIKSFGQFTLGNPPGIQIPSPADVVGPRLLETDHRRNLILTQSNNSFINDPFHWSDVGFLAWIRSPLEQFKASNWTINTTVKNLVLAWDNVQRETTSVPEVLSNSSTTELIPGIPSASKTPTNQMMVVSTCLNQEVWLQLDAQLATTSATWFDLHGRYLNAAQRPDHSELFQDRDLRSEAQTPRIAIPTSRRESAKRFFVHDQNLWNDFLQYASEPYGSIHATNASEVIREWITKYQEHVGLEIDESKSRLLHDFTLSKKTHYRDRISEEGGIVYWHHAVGIEPSRIEGNPITQTTRTPIGTLDPNGWVYLRSGKRVLYSAIGKWSDELMLGNSDQINSLIDGLISPFNVDADSKQYGIFIGGTGMHMFGLGNVERLYNAYQGTKFYYGGIGNPIEYDSFYRGYTDNGLGVGWQAILDRIEADIITYYRGYQKLHIFGWSRGAAMAIEFAKRMERYQIDIEFLGLFDPVYSYILPGQSSALIQWSPSGRDGNYVATTVAANVKAIGAIYAINEDRSFFPATRLYADRNTQVKLMKSPGTHGEIGGHFLSNSILQRLNFRAMMEYALNDGRALFEFKGIDEDLVRIYSSALTRKIQLAGASNPLERLETQRKCLVAASLENWRPPDDDQYYRSLIECTAENWKSGGFGFQKDSISGMLLFAIETSKEILPSTIFPNPLVFWQDGKIHQSPWTHYRRNLDWCKLEIWDLHFLEDSNGNSRITALQKQTIRWLYRLGIDPETGDWTIAAP